MDETIVDTAGVVVVVIGVLGNVPKRSAPVDGMEGKDENCVAVGKETLALVVLDLSNVVVLDIGGIPIVTVFSLVVAIPKNDGILVVIEFPEVVAVDDTIGVVPNIGRRTLVDTGLSVIVVDSDDDTIGVTPNTGAGLVVFTAFTLVVTGNDVIGIVLVKGKVILLAVVVIAGEVNNIFSLVVV